MITSNSRMSLPLGHPEAHGGALGTKRGRSGLISPALAATLRMTGFLTSLNSPISQLPRRGRIGEGASIPNVRRPCVRQRRMLKVINVIPRKLKPGQLEEARPADALDPLAHPLVSARVFRVDIHNLHYGLNHLRTARRVVGQDRD